MNKKYVFRVIVTLVLVGIFAFFIDAKGKTDSEWSELEVSFVGDSITEQGFFEHKEYPNIVNSELNLKKINNYGGGGSSLSVRKNEFDSLYPPLVDRWEDLKESDIFFILIGTNDYSSQVPLGDENSLSPDEFNGALNIVIDGLSKKYPDSKIVISTILKRKDNNLDLNVEDYNTVIEQKALEYDLVLFDGYNVPNLDIGNDHNGEITKDRLHPNKQGAKILGGSVIDFFEENKDILMQ